MWRYHIVSISGNETHAMARNMGEARRKQKIIEEIHNTKMKIVDTKEDPIYSTQISNKDKSSFSKGYWMEDETIPSFLK